MAYNNNVNLFSVNISNASQKAAANRSNYVSRQTANNDFSSQLDRAAAKTDSSRYTSTSNDSTAAKADNSYQKNAVSTDKDVQKLDVQSDDVKAADTADTKLKADTISPDKAIVESKETGSSAGQEEIPENSNPGSSDALFQFMTNSGNLDSLLGTLQQAETVAVSAVNEAVNAVNTVNAGIKTENSGFVQNMLGFMQDHVNILNTRSQQVQAGIAETVNTLNSVTDKAAAAINGALENAKTAIPEGFTMAEENVSSLVNQQPQSVEALLGLNENGRATEMLNLLTNDVRPVQAMMQQARQDVQVNTVQQVQTAETAVQVQAAGILQQSSAVQEEAADSLKVLADMMGETKITVEAEAQPQPVQQYSSNQQFDFSQNHGQQFAQGQSQQFQQPQPMVNVNGEVQPMQMPGQAAFDAAPVADNAQNADTSTAAGANFQQQLNAVNDLENPQQVQQPQQSRTDYDIPKQIVEQAKLIKAGENTEMVMKLNPEHLGQLSLKVSINGNGGVTATFHSDSATVRGIIETSMIQLKNELAEQGLKVDKVEVSAQLPDQQMPQDMGQGYYAQQSGQGNGGSRRSNGGVENYEEGADGEPIASGSIDADGEYINNSSSPIRDALGNIISDGVDYTV